ncbi:unnamed protein product [Bursaphelenchus xylophilus]|uniref:Carboxypeptidase n=2 Tax=Bursaphelenchus xylophilus TaxID=6326 RepID=A0A811M3T7_BURXY|nr:unnamed protein product [Bursaphelenchus xylophilus]CAG9131761.1 unnamed protein product [Bursaphelenchus xylophilus]
MDPIEFADPTKSECSQKIFKIADVDFWHLEGWEPYNFAEDCYSNDYSLTTVQRFLRNVLAVKEARESGEQPLISDGINRFVDQGALINPLSSDASGGFTCYKGEAISKYLNDPKVQKALHVEGTWQNCDDYVNEVYLQTYQDTTEVFKEIFASSKNLHILFYNGDADGVCNFLGTEWFVDELPFNWTAKSKRTEWVYTKNDFNKTYAGFQKTLALENIRLDVVTVAGAGHMVPLDRPGPAFQLFENFLRAEDNYGNAVSINETGYPIRNKYLEKVPEKISRKEADRIHYLPGLTYDPKFEQYSGYLRATKGNYLHYWLVKSQNNPRNDPLILWLNGGPGCSSLMGLLVELGPFRPNPDGLTLSENVFGWNKAANVLFLEGPRDVGFSYQNATENEDHTYSDEKTAEDNYQALKDFFEEYPEFKRRDFYIMGESYGGVYVPTLTARTIKGIQSGDMKDVNLVGMAVGNGILSSIEQMRSNAPLLYHRALIDKSEWDQYFSCCEGDYNHLAECDITKFIYVNSSGDANPRNSSDACSVTVTKLAQRQWFLKGNNVYNILQDCYQQKEAVFGSLETMKNKYAGWMTARSSEPPVNGQFGVNTINNIFSTDNQGGFTCYANAAAEKWLESKDVRKALNVPSYVQPWHPCNDTINQNYQQQHNDTGPVFDEIIESEYPLRVLIYNGDTDLACNFLGDQWLVERVAKKHGLKTSRPYNPWNVKGQIAGYEKQFSNKKVSIDLLTVKGAGHLVPLDRPEASLQMINNFIGEKDYSDEITVITKEKPLREAYQIKEKFADAVGNVSPLDLFSRDNLHITAANEYYKRRRPRDDKKIENLVKKSAVLPPPKPGSASADLIRFTTSEFTFQDAPPQWSGYLNARDDVHLHYWLSRHNTDPSAPLILWLNGGPGCSSLGGLFKELGLFHATRDAQRLDQNRFSWTKVANVLFLEAPQGVGFSYSSNPNKTEPYDDDRTAAENANALEKFLERFPEFKGRPFYVTGESYGGIYVPTLVREILRRKTTPNSPMKDLNLKGFAIGNGMLSRFDQVNSAVHLMYYRGFYDRETYEEILSCCNDTRRPEECNLSSYVHFKENGDSEPRHFEDPKSARCAELVDQYGFWKIWESTVSVYNSYQDCYKDDASSSFKSVVNAAAGKKVFRTKRSAGFKELGLSEDYTFVDEAKLYNKHSTDAHGGFECYDSEVTEKFLNKAAIKKLIHVNREIKWEGCNDEMNQNYIQQNHDTRPVWDEILDLLEKLKITNFKSLVYNGDADLACEYLGNEWFLYRLATERGLLPKPAEPWTFSEPKKTSGLYFPRMAGTVRQFRNNRTSLDFLTVKGGGHFVPQDRAPIALQMIANFVRQNSARINYSTPLSWEDLKLLPAKPSASYIPKPPRRAMDKIFNLPGLTFQPKFEQHSGYLNVSKGNYLHYWFVESQKKNAPLLLWLTGGPGCSSLGALFGENGPFYVNPDGQTLFENVFSWNKVANVLYIESPRGVGFSYQDHEDNKDTNFNDEKSTEDVLLALREFLKIYEIKNDFYITGESYAGVYVPALTRRILQELDKENRGIFYGVPLDFKGFLVGNPYVSVEGARATRVDYSYTHGLIGKKEFLSIRKECCPDSKTELCPMPVNLTETCDKKMRELWSIESFDPYNLIQQCYEHTGKSVLMQRDNGVKQTLLSSIESLSLAQKHYLDGDLATASHHSLRARINYASSDANGGLRCYVFDKMTDYLNQEHVREAIHVPKFVQDWEMCSGGIGDNYTMQFNTADGDMSQVFYDILDSKYAKENKDVFKMMIYNGDTDLVCGFKEAEYFVEKLSQNYKGEASVTIPRHPWYAQLPKNGKKSVAGFRKQFKFDGISLDLVTIKGSGHFVPLDRPLASLQLLENFINHKNISEKIPYSTEPARLLSQYEPELVDQPARPFEPTIGPLVPEPTPPEDDTTDSTGDGGDNTPTPAPKSALSLQYNAILLLVAAWLLF